MPGSAHELLPVFHVDNFKSLEAEFSPDIYIVGLQEMVELTAINCIKKDNKKYEIWSKLIGEAIDIVNSEIVKNS